MNAKIIKQYSDLLQEVRETEDRVEKLRIELRKIEKGGTVIDKVNGGEGGIKPFRIEGFPMLDYEHKKAVLNARILILEDLQARIATQIVDVEQYISQIDDSNMRRIITMRVIDEKTWDEIADRLGIYETADSVRKKFVRFLEK